MDGGMEAAEVRASLPAYKFGLRAAIVNCGYRTLGEFADQFGIPRPILSEIVNGWRLPNAKYQRILSRALGLSLKELCELL
jgi:hypothetical protein